MKITATISYPGGTTPQQVYKLATDAGFRDEVCEATHALAYESKVDVHPDDTASVVVSRTMPAEVPDFIKKMIGDTVGVTQTEEWGSPDDSGQRMADVTVQIKGQPATMKGTATIALVPSGVEMRVDGDLKVSIPFVGKKIEPEIAKGIYAALRAEERQAAQRLS
jgi:hypothetical protein